MSISVVIPSLNEQDHIKKAIRSVETIATEVIVADANSGDATRDIAESCGALVVVCEKGRGGQLRQGATFANERTLLFLHADSWLDQRAACELQQLVVGSSSRQPLFGCFRQQIDDPRLRFRILEAGNAFRANWLRMPYGDQAIFVDRARYDEAGGFDDVPLMEDVMLCQRLRKAGRPILLNGPVHLSARRWQTDGLIRRTLRNWFIFGAFRSGVSPQQLAKWYA